MKKTLLISLALIIMASATACSNAKDDATINETSQTEASQTETPNEEQSEEEKSTEYEGTTYKLGETVSTQVLEFTLDRADLAIAMVNTLDENYGLPKEYNSKEDSSNPLVAAKGTTFIPLTFTINNLDRASLDIDFADWVTKSKINVIYDGETYTFDGFDNDIKHIYELFENGGYDTYEYGNIILRVGEKRTFRAYVKLPVDIADLNSEFIITFDLPDANETFVECAYRVTVEDRNTIKEKAETAAEEKRKRIEEMNAVELAEVDKETETKLKRSLSGWNWDYTDDNNCYHFIEFVDDSNITVKVTLANGTITNSGTYSIRNKVIYVRYQNGGEAKIPYVLHDGRITLFPIVGMEESGTYEFRPN